MQGGCLASPTTVVFVPSLPGFLALINGWLQRVPSTPRTPQGGGSRTDSVDRANGPRVDPGQRQGGWVKRDGYDGSNGEVRDG